MTLMFAYGSNLSKAAMRQRCPEARPVCSLMLTDARLVFRGVADCVYEKGATCPGAIWKITPRCERALDRYEGIRPDGSGSYRREYVPVEGLSEGTEMMYYAMNSTGIYPPGEYYLDVLERGYKDFGLPLEMLQAAVDASWDNKAPSHRERFRRDRDGKPPLAKKARVVPVPALVQASLFPDVGA